MQTVGSPVHVLQLDEQLTQLISCNTVTSEGHLVRHWFMKKYFSGKTCMQVSHVEVDFEHVEQGALQVSQVRAASFWNSSPGLHCLTHVLPCK